MPKKTFIAIIIFMLVLIAGIWLWKINSDENQLPNSAPLASQTAGV